MNWYQKRNLGVLTTIWQTLLLQKMYYSRNYKAYNMYQMHIKPYFTPTSQHVDRIIHERY